MSKTIKLTQKKNAIVDDDDFEKINSFPSKWYFSKRGYAQTKIKKTGEHFSMHRIILGIQNNSNIHCDHINGNSLDNRKCNLRICTHKENMRNSKVRKHNKCGVKGVHKTKFETYQAQITVNGNVIRAGNYNNIHDAALAYNREAKKHFGVFARLNNLPKWFNENKILVPNKCGGDRTKHKTKKGEHYAD